MQAESGGRRVLAKEHYRGAPSVALPEAKAKEGQVESRGTEHQLRTGCLQFPKDAQALRATSVS